MGCVPREQDGTCIVSHPRIPPSPHPRNVHLGALALGDEEDPREGIREAAAVGCEQTPGLVHVGSQLENLFLWKREGMGRLGTISRNPSKGGLRGLFLLTGEGSQLKPRIPNGCGFLWHPVRCVHNVSHEQDRDEGTQFPPPSSPGTTGIISPLAPGSRWTRGCPARLPPAFSMSHPVGIPYWCTGG